MKKILITTIFMMGISLYSFEEWQTSFENYEGKSFCYIKNSGELCNGTLKVYYNSSGQLKKEANFENGLLNGTSKEYYSNGKILQNLNYTNGIMIGTQKYYYENGETKFIENYSTDAKLKYQKFYNYDGKITSEIKYS
ncbi:MAG: toxin-antitoxin system YwqK family antitoxin, partial [Fusobacteriaceae bacterium]